MVKGLQKLREHFRDHRNTFVVIGGVACDEWLGLQGLPFRPTRDVDMVLVVEALTPAFVSRFWEFVRAGKYDTRQRSTDKRIYYRFSKPAAPDFPAMIEIFSRQPTGLDLAADQEIVPIAVADDLSSLSNPIRRIRHVLRPSPDAPQALRHPLDGRPFGLVRLAQPEGDRPVAQGYRAKDGGEGGILHIAPTPDS